MWSTIAPDAPGAPFITLANERQRISAYSMPFSCSNLRVSPLGSGNGFISFMLVMESGATHSATNSNTRSGLGTVTLGSTARYSCSRVRVSLDRGLAYVSITCPRSSMGRLSIPIGHPEPTSRSHSIPSRLASCMAIRSMSIHSSLNHIREAFPTESHRFAGNSMGLISTPPMPASCNSRNSRTISALSTLSPFHHHLTKGLVFSLWLSPVCPMAARLSSSRINGMSLFI